MTANAEPSNAQIVAPLLEEWARLDAVADMVGDIIALEVEFGKLDGFLCQRDGQGEYFLPFEAIGLDARMAAKIIQLGWGELLRSNRDIMGAYLTNRFQLTDDDFDRCRRAYKAAHASADE